MLLVDMMQESLRHVVPESRVGYLSWTPYCTDITAYSGFVGPVQTTSDLLACYERKSSAAAHFVYCIILLGHIAMKKKIYKKIARNVRFGKKGLHLHISPQHALTSL